MISIDKVIDFFCIADHFRKEYSSEVQKKQKSKMVREQWDGKR